MKKTLLMTAATVGILGGGLLMASSAFAQTLTPDQSPITSLVQEISDKFHLNKSDVQAVFDNHRQEMQTKFETRYEDKLAQLVKDGKITDQQKQLLLDEHKKLESEMQSNKDNFKNMTPAERKAQMDAKKKEIDDWAKQNGIDAKYLMFGEPVVRGHMFRMHGGDMHETITPNPTQ